MRIQEKKEDISYKETINFFNKRVKKYQEDNPYSVTMYQDDNPDLVKARNNDETQKLLSKMELGENSTVLDVACGIGRWSDAIKKQIKKYCGTDFCEGFISIAKERNYQKKNRHFYVSRNDCVAQTITENNEGLFNRILLIGSLVYLNDAEVFATLEDIESLCEEKTIICIREPIALENRLTLKDNYSEELKDVYNAIYRTRDELIEMFETKLINKGFKIVEENFLFDDSKLNNRRETSQYYFILER